MAAPRSMKGVSPADLSPAEEVEGKIARMISLQVRSDSPPKAFSPEIWNTVTEDEREEARDRAAFILFRGRRTADESLMAALAGMDHDLTTTEDRFSWPTVHGLIGSWPPPRRLPDGSLPWALLNLAAHIERNVWAEIDHPGAIADPRPHFEHLAPNAKVLDAAVATFRKVLLRFKEALAAEAAALEGVEDVDQSDKNEAVHIDEAPFHPQS